MNPMTPPTLNPDTLAQTCNRIWDAHILPALHDYIAIPAKSPMFDTAWADNGHIERVVRDAAAWVERQGNVLHGLKLEVIRAPGRTPVILFELPATKAGSTDTVLLYGHLDKQPEFSGWRNDLGPWTPKLLDGKLYGRGGADDGYAIYASLTALIALDEQGIARPRCVGLIETCEESGSFDLPPYIELLKPRFGNVSLVVCLDSGAGDYEQLWLTTSLRGNVTGSLKVEVLAEGVHSGDASGIVPSSFRIMRQLLDRLEDAKTGALLPEDFHCPIPEIRVQQARETAAVLGDAVYKRLPWACGADGGAVLPMSEDPAQVLINGTWKPTLSVTGVDGMPPLANAGNVLRPYTSFKLSLRLPPLVDGNAAALKLKALLEDNAPYNARVTFEPDGRMGAYGATGWNTPDLQPWLLGALDSASRSQFGRPVGFVGQGGTIPLMNLLQQGFPAAQMMVCGVLGPKSNAHGPNEFLHVDYAKRLTATVAQVIAAHP
nr:M20/M25/M40 family metallo-hydrolase [Inhella inkyongensis]